MIEEKLGQILITSVLLSMIAGAILIRFNHAIAKLLAGDRRSKDRGVPVDLSDTAGDLSGTAGSQVVIGGYGRVGHTIAVLLKSSKIPFVVFETDTRRVAQGQADGHPVLYGDISDPELLSTIHVERASLVVITIDQSDMALRAVSFLRKMCPQVPVIARARDLESSSQLLEAGATHAYPEAIEASLRLGATAMQILRVPSEDIDLLVQGVRDWDYKPVLEEKRS